MQKFLRVVAAGVVMLCGLPAAAQQTLEAVKKRGEVV